MDAVIAKADQEKPSLRPFLFVSGLAGHKEIYDVRLRGLDSSEGVKS